MSNVIDFTKAKEKLTQTFDDDKSDQYDIDDMIIDISIDFAHDILAQLRQYGFDPYDAKCANDIVLLVESLKGLMFRTRDEKFPTQELSRIIFEIQDPETFMHEFLNNDSG